MASHDTDELLTAALGLPPDERERSAHELLDSLDDEQSLTREEREAAWEEEIERSVREIREGKAELIDGEQVFRDARARIAARRK